MTPTHAELNAALRAPAFIDELEIPVLCRYAAGAERIVEIGAAWGASSVLFLMNMPEVAHLSSVDPFVQDSMAQWQSSQGACIQAVYQALAALGQLERFPHWSLIPHTSAYVAERWQAPTPIDLLYIDGAHDEFNVHQDWRLWTPFVRAGGVVLLHDSRRLDGHSDHEYAQGWRAPTALANRLRGDANWKLVEEAFSLTAWAKR